MNSSRISMGASAAIAALVISVLGVAGPAGAVAPLSAVTEVRSVQAADPTSTPSATPSPAATPTVTPSPTEAEAAPTPTPTVPAPRTPDPAPLVEETPVEQPTPTPTPTPTTSPSITTQASVADAVTSNLPTIDIELTDPVQQLEWVHADKDNRAAATISLTDPAGTYTVAPQVGSELKGRGNFTWTLDKKPYQIKFPAAVDVLGLGSAKTWILLANHADASLMRNKIAFDLAESLGLPFTPASRWVDLRINGEYQGNYLLAEKVEVKKNRIELTDPRGVVAELDNNYGTAEDYFFRSGSTSTVITLKDAKSEVPSLPEGVASNSPDYLPADTLAGWEDMKSSLNALDAALRASDPDWSAISALIDVDSFVKFYFVQELTENSDIVASSVYLYKDGPDDKIHAGPVWDFDIALFNHDKGEQLGADPLSDYVKNIGTLRSPYRPSNPWFQDLYRNVGFAARANELWQESVGEAIAGLPARIDEYEDAVAASAVKNFVRWPILGTPSMLGPSGKQYSPSYAAEVAYLRERVSARIGLLTAEYGAVPMIQYRAHVQSIGWDKERLNGQIVGTFGKSLRLEALSLSLLDPAGQVGTVQAQSHVQKVGWSEWGSTSLVGTEGQGLRLEAVRFRLTGSLEAQYDVQYRAHVQSIGWQDWVASGAIAGTEGRALRIEALQVRLVKKVTATPVPPPGDPAVSYSAHVQSLGWMASVTDGETAGTTGRSLRLEALRMAFSGIPYTGGFIWRGHVQRIGWQPWTGGGEIGTTGLGLRLEAFAVELTGVLADHYSVRYRAHVQGVGWQAWRTEGEISGTVGRGLRIEAVQIELVPKG